jgi:ketosteroid isomerase-like protein
MIKAHHTTNADVAILEYEGRSGIVQAKRPYLQKYIAVLTFRDGLKAHWKDYRNPKNVLAAMGDADY